jgi:hypothetical protein
MSRVISIHDLKVVAIDNLDLQGVMLEITLIKKIAFRLFFIPPSALRLPPFDFFDSPPLEGLGEV